MIQKKEGVINEIIYNNTSYYNGEYRIYPTIDWLQRIIQEIIKSSTTTTYIRITPFYKNAKIKGQIEFEDYMLYLECRERINERDKENHIELCIGKKYDVLSIEEKRLGKILFPICEYRDTESYKMSLELYIKYLDELIPNLMEVCKFKLDLNEKNWAFGYFCFEIHSG